MPVEEYSDGNVSRNTFTYPGRQDWNLSLGKRFMMPYKEGHLLKFRMDLFNAFNLANLGVNNLNGDIWDSNFLNMPSVGAHYDPLGQVLHLTHPGRNSKREPQGSPLLSLTFLVWKRRSLLYSQPMPNKPLACSIASARAVHRRF